MEEFECKRGFKTCSDRLADLCKVEYHTEYLIKCLDKPCRQCEKNLNMEGGTFCICPFRREIIRNAHQ